MAIIHLRPLLPAAWCDLPGGSGEQPSGASADARTRPLDLAPGGVYRATPVTWGAGGLLHHRFTLTSDRTSTLTSSVRGRFVLCGTVPRVAPGGRYPPPCSVESGLSSTASKGGRDRLTDSSQQQATRLWLLGFSERRAARLAYVSNQKGRRVPLRARIRCVSNQERRNVSKGPNPPIS